MSNKVFEEAPQAPQPSGGAADKVRKAARQLAYDTRYKVKGKFKEGQKTDPTSLQRAYMQQLGASSAPGPVKLLAKKMLMGEQYDFAMVESSLPQIFNKVFVEGVGEYVLRVKDPKAGSQYTRSYGTYAAAEAKASELRKKGLRVELANASSSAKKDTYDNKGSGSDRDGDGEVESSSKEHAGVVHNAIQRAKGGKEDGKDTRKEEVIYEKEENGEKKLDVMKGKNTIKVNPSLGESIRAELDLLKAQRIAEQDASMKQKDDEEKEKQLAKQQQNTDKSMKIRILQNKMRAVRGGAEIAASHELKGDTIVEGEGMMRYCPKCDKDETRDECKYGGEYWDENSKPAKNEEDPRSMPTKINLAKNKLRAMGLKMSYDMEGDMVDEKYQGMYQSPAPTYNRLNSKDPKARMSPGSRAMAKSDKLQSTEPGSKRAKKQKKVSDQINRNFQSARKTVGEGLSVKDQMKVSQEYFKKRNSRSPEEKKAKSDKDAKDRAKNYAMHKKPDPYRSRPGESD